MPGCSTGAPVTVLGFARSGIALARFLADAGRRVTVYDGRPAEELGGCDRGARRPAGPARRSDPTSTRRRRWADAALVTTSPSINPDYPTTEPRLRAALRALVEARGAGDRTAPALVSEPDLFLRLCPAPTIGVTGTKGKTTTSSLTAAILAADPAHPAVLGGNIGDAARRAAGRADARSSRRVRALGAAAADAVAGHDGRGLHERHSDHLDRHGTLEAYRRVKRRLAELVDPGRRAGPQRRRPGRRRLRRPRHGAGRPATGATARRPAASASSTAGSSRTASSAWPRRRWRRRPARTDGSCRSRELGIPGAHNVSNALAAVAVGPPLRPRARRRSARRPPRSPGVEHRLEPVALIDGVRFVNDSQGTQPDAVIAALRAFDPPIVLIAGGRDKGVDLSALAPVAAERAAAAVLIGESGPDARAPLPRRRARRRRARRDARRRGGPRPTPSRAMPWRAGGGARAGDGPAQPGRRQLRHVRRLRRPRSGLQGRGRRPRASRPGRDR